MTSLLLARAGVESAVFERKPGTSAHPKAMGVSRRTAEILRQHGLMERILGGSLPIEGQLLGNLGKVAHWRGIWTSASDGLAFGIFPLPSLCIARKRGPRKFFSKPWITSPLLRCILAPKWSRSIREKTRCFSSSSTGETVHAQWVVAADGAGSGVRRQLSIETDGPGDMGHFVNVMFHAGYGQHLGGPSRHPLSSAFPGVLRSLRRGEWR